MELYISELSKYVIAVLLALYTIQSFLIYLPKTENGKRVIYALQNIFMFLFHFSCFVVICFETKDLTNIFFYVFQEVILFAAIALYRMIYPQIHKLLINNMCMLLCISFCILTRIDQGKALKQFFIVAISLVITMFIPYLIRKLDFLKDLEWIYALIGIAALSLVLILGQVTHGSKISYSIGGVTFQPSEIVKIVFVFYLAAALFKNNHFFTVFITALIGAVHVGTLVVSRDLGSALIFFVVYILLVFISTKNVFYLFAGLAGGCGAAIMAYRVFRHVQVRVQAFKDPWSVIDKEGFQITQSLFAISSGGPFGLGLYKGKPADIPFVEDDFIFSAIAEELGIIVAISMLLICVSTFICFMTIALSMKDSFYQLIVSGIGIMYIFQIFLTVGGGSKFIPLTGVTLPLISYGGSSVLTTLMMFAIAEGFYLRELDDEEERRIRHMERMKRKKAKERARRRRERQQSDSDNTTKRKRPPVPQDTLWNLDLEIDESFTEEYESE